MQTSDISLYSVGIVVILASIYLFPLIFTGQVEAKSIPFVQKWTDTGKTVALDQFEGGIKPEDPALEHPVLEQVSRYGASWWNDESIFQFERRAIFSKTWIFVAHASRFHKPGDYRTFEIAGFSFIIILGKDRQIRAFHNVCRHRAYAVTKKESGSSTVLGCRYHGWSYDTKGQLIKAPEFDGVAGFNKDQNNLWELQTEIKDSMIFVNFDAGDEKQALDLEASEAILKKWKTPEMEWTTGWKINGAFNWKLAVGELSLDRGTEAAPESLWQSIIGNWQTSQDKEFRLSHTTIVRQLPSGQMLTIRLLPQSAQTTTIQCDVYAKKGRINKAEQKDLHLLKDLIQEEVKKLEAKQQGLVAGNGEVSSPCQEELSDLLKTHLRAERALGTEIHPAARKQSFNTDRKADDDLCAELENNDGGVCKANSKGLLDW